MKIMKKNFLWMTIVMIAIMCASCSNNDDEFVNLAQKVAGVYKGDVSATFKYSSTPLTYTDESLTVTSNEDGTANLVFESGEWGTYEIKNMQISEANDVYSFSGSGAVSIGMEEDSKKSYDFTVTGTLNTSKVMNITFSIPTVMGGVTLTFISSEGK